MKDIASTKKYLENVVQELQYFNRDELQEYIVELSNQLNSLAKEQRIATNEVVGCASKTYVVVTQENGVFIAGESDSVFIKAFLHIISKALSGLSVEDVRESKEVVTQFITVLQHSSELTTHRSGSFLKVYDHIIAHLPQN